ncbi:DUF6603 domain-containing protein [Nostoc sp. 106C]|uniref:DUF6603 domain-containing protein n=1 Tax=Nostoc sp. 106C TaxID=1932667 RepID=UPI000A3A2473|nr:DUF6603 domain-containing protein [Nostoc sp. 106C]OUL36552.1 hypothetical protein BV375_00045 [Nostoc sp. 106C]
MQTAVTEIIKGIREISNAPDAAIPVKLRNDNFKAIFPHQLLDYLIINYLNSYQSRFAFFLRSVGIVKIQYLSPGGNRKPYMHYSLNFSDIPDIFANPKRILENTFAWGTNNFAYDEFLYQVENLLMSLDIDVFMDNVQGVVINRLEQSSGLDNSTIRKVLRGVFFERYRSGGRLAAEVRLVGLRGDASQKPGIAIMPAFNGILDVKMNLGPDIAVKIGSQLDFQGGVGLIIRPERPITILTGFNQANTATTASGRITVVVDRSNFDNQPIVIIGSSSGTRLEYRKIGGTGGVSLDNQNRVDIFAEFEAKGLKFIFKPDGDSFIRKLLPGEGFALETNLILGISYLHGFYFLGSAALEIDLPTHIQLGVIELQSLIIALRPQAQKLPVDLGVTFKGDLGPLKVVVQNIGLSANFSFPANGGNLGLIDLNLGFKPPTGAGLSIDAGVIKGGGFLAFDSNRQEYAGALELVFSEFLNLKAIGLITTRMPDGSPGFSLLIIITADFGTGIQLGFGFTLLAVGGLIGLNRTMRLEPLTEGVRTGAINSILFPRDVIANAPRIISDLRTIFPPEEGKFLIGPMAKIGWGTPTLISLSLGIIIEIPGNIAILGVLRVALPTDELALIVLQVNFIGAIEFDRKRVYFFASLFESRLLFMTLEGEMGLLVAFGDDANFVLTVGGFHPQFNPPPLPFPNPARISVNYLNEANARIRVMNYFAVTSNTAQIGAHAELFFGFDDFSVEGHIGFDALIQFSPFHFIIEVSASVSLKAFGVGVFSISLRFSLEGPTPWRARGTGSISLFFFDISADFDITWGESRNTTLPPIPVMPLLRGELEKLDNWRAVLPETSNLLVTLRKSDTAADTLVLHPVGVLKISQKAIPLDLPIDKVGNQKPSDAKRFSLNVTSGGLERKADATEQFAIAQFQNLEDASKLSRRAYEPQHSGLELSVEGQQLASSKMVKRVIRYEEIIIDNNFKRFIRLFSVFVGVLFNHFLNGASVAKSALSQSYQQKLQPFSQKIAAKSDSYVVAFQATNKVVSSEAAFVSQASANDYLQQQIARDPNLSDSLHVIPTHEVQV